MARGGGLGGVVEGSATGVSDWLMARLMYTGSPPLATAFDPLFRGPPLFRGKEVTTSSSDLPTLPGAMLHS